MHSGVIAATNLALALLAPTDEGRRLFNGKDLTGWAHVGKGRVYVEDGLLKTGGGMGLLWYTGEKFGDCTIRVVSRTTTVDDNSGIFVCHLQNDTCGIRHTPPASPRRVCDASGAQDAMRPRARL